jgi:hypothetical protein
MAINPHMPPLLKQIIYLGVILLILLYLWVRIILYAPGQTLFTVLLIQMIIISLGWIITLILHMGLLTIKEI